jgi:hypothetical protein
MMRGAFRPHPDLQKHIQQLVGSMDNQTSDGSYMALHARVEPDMQRHPVCRDIKVISLQAIFDSMQTQFPELPASKLFIAINRPMLEKEGSNLDGENQVAVENLAVLIEFRWKVFGMEGLKYLKLGYHLSRTQDSQPTLESQAPLSTISWRWEPSYLWVPQCPPSPQI